jgi:hypothetical protein
LAWLLDSAAGAAQVGWLSRRRKFSAVRRGSGGDAGMSTPMSRGVSGTRKGEWGIGGLEGSAKLALSLASSALALAFFLLPVLLLLLPPLLLLPLSFFEELAELRLDPGVLCLAPPGGAEGVG